MRDLLTFFGIDPVLVDVGASLGSPDVWRPIAANSTYLGFDPDRREAASAAQGGFRRTVIVNEAVTSEPGTAEVRFFLTRAPACSSTLEPDLASLANYHIHDLFLTERQATVPAATLDAILARLGLDRIDWLKCDSQGTDLRIFRSLGERLRPGVLALDIEPGLIDAYRGEDLFVDAQKHLVANGFWLSRLEVKGAVRARSATLRAAVSGRGGCGGLRGKSGSQVARLVRSALPADTGIDGRGGCHARALCAALCVLAAGRAAGICAGRSSGIRAAVRQRRVERADARGFDGADHTRAVRCAVREGEAPAQAPA